MSNKTLPLDDNAESSLLGCLILDETLFTLVNDQISPNDFYNTNNKLLYKTIVDLKKENKNIDVSTIISSLKATNSLEQVGGLNYINTIANLRYSVVNIDSYIKTVKDNSLIRTTIDTLSVLANKGYEPGIKANDYLLQVEEKVFELSKNKKTEQFSNMKSVLEKVEENVNRNFDNKDGLTGLDTGFTELNNITLGLQKESLIILAARPAMGKSAFAMNLALQVASSAINKQASVAVFSLEMSSDQLAERIIASDATIPLSVLKKGALSSTDWRLFNSSISKLSKLNIYFDDSTSINISDIRTKCRKLSADKGLDFVVIDYLQLIEGDPGKSKQEEVAKISRSLKLMARELQVPVLALAQLSREVEKREDKKPIMADLRDSGSIEQDADIVMFLYREEYYKKNTERLGEADLIISKNRSGSAGIELKYLFNGKFSKFTQKDTEEV
ncbi:MAG: replicative DNA helicase [Anaeroplasmataceae bacterium]